MRTIHGSRLSSFGIVALLVGTLATPMAVNAEEHVLAMVSTAPSWDDASGYGSVEANRAGTAIDLAPTTGTPWEATSGYRSVEANRLLIAEYALLSGDLGSVQEQYVADLVTLGRAGQPVSSYDSLEASRAGASGLIVSPTES
jgi:hypothetical protein